MAPFVIVHGGGGSSWEWQLVVAELARLGHEAVAVDLPTDDDSKGLADYADTVVDAVGDRSDVVLVAHSLGGFTAPLAAARVPLRRLVLVAAMIPAAGETATGWWASSGYHVAAAERAQREGVVVDMSDDAGTIAAFMHDVDPVLATEALRHGREQTDRAMHEAWPLRVWPDVPTSFLVLGDDRFFPPEFLAALARERLGIDADVMPGSHSAYLSRPAELARRLAAYAALPVTADETATRAAR
ncbi:alpha/beta fold hydrolase [Georgenia subflava]|uniref:Alpha/beta fold hydrolase n=1 Tax=Georgenia subflava TaxID=1622177 RepID=A0A6N7EDV4_9MICO|nr:alpha/beta fold hydrolase [Georgenia subflava]MPV36190.1 alpha/beta fold hydrolase [Georgenia subflava]